MGGALPRFGLSGGAGSDELSGAKDPQTSFLGGCRLIDWRTPVKQARRTRCLRCRLPNALSAIAQSTDSELLRAANGFRGQTR